MFMQQNVTLVMRNRTQHVRGAWSKQVCLVISKHGMPVAAARQSIQPPQVPRQAHQSTEPSAVAHAQQQGLAAGACSQGSQGHAQQRGLSAEAACPGGLAASAPPPPANRKPSR